MDPAVARWRTLGLDEAACEQIALRVSMEHCESLSDLSKRTVPTVGRYQDTSVASTMSLAFSSRALIGRLMPPSPSTLSLDTTNVVAFVDAGQDSSTPESCVLCLLESAIPLAACWNQLLLIEEWMWVPGQSRIVGGKQVAAPTVLEVHACRILMPLPASVHSQLPCSLIEQQEPTTATGRVHVKGIVDRVDESLDLLLLTNGTRVMLTNAPFTVSPGLRGGAMIELLNMVREETSPGLGEVISWPQASAETEGSLREGQDPGTISCPRPFLRILQCSLLPVAHPCLHYLVPTSLRSFLLRMTSTHEQAALVLSAIVMENPHMLNAPLSAVQLALARYLQGEGKTEAGSKMVVNGMASKGKDDRMVTEKEESESNDGIEWGAILDDSSTDQADDNQMDVDVNPGMKVEEPPPLEDLPISHVPLVRTLRVPMTRNDLFLSSSLSTQLWKEFRDDYGCFTTRYTSSFIFTKSRPLVVALVPGAATPLVRCITLDGEEAIINIAGNLSLSIHENDSAHPSRSIQTVQELVSFLAKSQVCHMALSGEITIVRSTDEERSADQVAIAIHSDLCEWVLFLRGGEMIRMTLRLNGDSLDVERWLRSKLKNKSSFPLFGTLQDLFEAGQSDHKFIIAQVAGIGILPKRKKNAEGPILPLSPPTYSRLRLLDLLSGGLLDVNSPSNISLRLHLGTVICLPRHCFRQGDIWKIPDHSEHGILSDWFVNMDPPNSEYGDEADDPPSTPKLSVWLAHIPNWLWRPRPAAPPSLLANRSVLLRSPRRAYCRVRKITQVLIKCVPGAFSANLTIKAKLDDGSSNVEAWFDGLAALSLLKLQPHSHGSARCMAEIRRLARSYHEIHLSEGLLKFVPHTSNGKLDDNLGGDEMFDDEDEEDGQGEGYRFGGSGVDGVDAVGAWMDRLNRSFGSSGFVGAKRAFQISILGNLGTPNFMRHHDGRTLFSILHRLPHPLERIHVLFMEGSYNADSIKYANDCKTRWNNTNLGNLSFQTVSYAESKVKALAVWRDGE